MTQSNTIATLWKHARCFGERIRCRLARGSLTDVLRLFCGLVGLFCEWFGETGWRNQWGFFTSLGMGLLYGLLGLFYGLLGLFFGPAAPLAPRRWRARLESFPVDPQSSQDTATHIRESQYWRTGLGSGLRA